MKTTSSLKNVLVLAATLALVALGGCQGKNHMAMEKMDKPAMASDSGMATPMKKGEMGSMAMEETKPMAEMPMDKGKSSAGMAPAQEMAAPKPTM